MTPRRGHTTTRAQTRQTLRELIEAIDRRLPHVERAGERGIATEAARLRALALDRLSSLDRADQLDADGQTRTAGDVMSDDGGTPQQ